MSSEIVFRWVDINFTVFCISGADKEIENLKKIMEEVLNFSCAIIIDPDYDQINKIIEETAALLNRHSNRYYCFTFFIMGHGNQVSIVISTQLYWIKYMYELFHWYYDNNGKCNTCIFNKGEVCGYREITQIYIDTKHQLSFFFSNMTSR